METDGGRISIFSQVCLFSSLRHGGINADCTLLHCRQSPDVRGFFPGVNRGVLLNCPARILLAPTTHSLSIFTAFDRLSKTQSTFRVLLIAGQWHKCVRFFWCEWPSGHVPTDNSSA